MIIKKGTDPVPFFYGLLPGGLFLQGSNAFLQ
jgi:hypothetical protein